MLLPPEPKFGSKLDWNDRIGDQAFMVLTPFIFYVGQKSFMNNLNK